MSDYKEQANLLREHADLIETSIELYGPSATRLLVYDLRNAAAAIEELQAGVKRLNMRCADCEYASKPWPELEPKRGEWEPFDKTKVRCTSCGAIFGNAVVDLYKYCPMCGSDKGAKMEVQDG